MNEDIGISIDTAFELNDKPKDVYLKDKSNFKMNNFELKSLKYAELSTQLEDKLNKIQTDVHLDFINQMINFINEFKIDLNEENRFKFIHTCILSISCSTTEYEFIFDLFIKKLNESSISNVILISSNDKLTLEKIIDLIYTQMLTNELLGKIQVNGDRNEKRFKQTLKFKQFLAIYKKYNGDEPIILIIDDLISMNPETINSLFEFLYNNLDIIRFLVFCGLSQASVSLQSLIRPKILNYLCLNSFSSKESFKIIDEIFFSTFIESDLKLKFGSKLLGHFFTTFNYYDFSIKKIEHLAKLAIGDFCFSNEHAFLNGTLEEFKAKLDELDDKQLAKLKELDSLKECKFNDSKLKEQLIGLFKNVNEIEIVFVSELKALYVLIEKTSISDCFRSLYIDYLSTEEASFKEDLEKLSSELMSFTSDQWKTRLVNVMNNDAINQTELVQILSMQFDKLDAASLDESIVEEKKNSSLKNFHNRYEMLSQLAKKAKNPQSNTLFNSWKKETTSLIRKHFHELKNPSYQYLNELFYYDNLEQLKQFNLASTRETTLKRLANSDQFVKSIRNHSTKKKDNDHLLAFKPEICFAFKLYKEQQLKINLADWLESYLVVLEQNELENNTITKSSRKRKKIQLDKNKLTKKFFTNVYDLAHLGILEKTNRSNDDYVTKLILY